MHAHLMLQQLKAMLDVSRKCEAVYATQHRCTIVIESPPLLHETNTQTNRLTEHSSCYERNLHKTKRSDRRNNQNLRDHERENAYEEDLLLGTCPGAW